MLREAEAMRARVEIHVVVVCRTFDWRNDHRLRQLTRGGAEVLVGELADDETRRLLRRGGFEPSLFRERQLKLLRTAQNLSLFLGAGFDPDGVPAFDTVTELFDRYWDHKRSRVVARAGAAGDHWEEVLGLLCGRMAARQELSVRREVVDSVPQQYLDQLASEGVLSVDGKRYGFRARELLRLLLRESLVPARVDVAQVHAARVGTALVQAGPGKAGADVRQGRRFR